MENYSLFVWCGIAAVLFIAFCYTVWRKLSVMNNGKYNLFYNDDTVDVVPEFVEVEDDELDL